MTQRTEKAVVARTVRASTSRGWQSRFRDHGNPRLELSGSLDRVLGVGVKDRNDELVFVPNLGFRLAQGALRSENVVVRRGAQTLTAGVTSDRDGAELSVTFSGIEEQLDFRKSRQADAPVRIVDDHGRVLAEGRAAMSCRVISIA